jgi:ADP-ribosylglycohydrolase
VSCQGTVPEALIAFLDSISYEDTIRNAISLGGDADTLACIAGGIAEAFYGNIPQEMIETAKNMLTPDLLIIVETFYDIYNL